jgi:predicted NBD/HSP70 family sugar kinase
VHEQFEERLDRLIEKSGVGQEMLGEVLARASLRAPEETSRVEIAAGNPAARRPVDQRGIPQGTVSKAVKALMHEGLLEEGERFLKSPDGRTVAPVRLGRDLAISGVNLIQRAGVPSAVTTALVGLDGTTLLEPDFANVTETGPSAWGGAPKVIYEQITRLLIELNRRRDAANQAPAELFGVGIQVGSPVYNGRVLPISNLRPQPVVDLGGGLSKLLDGDAAFSGSVPVVVENDVNALAVLAIHEIHYVDSDFVVVGVFDEGIGGGLVMDGRVRRGGNGKAMEIGHLGIGFPPGEDPEGLPPDPAATVNTGFSDPCQCGRFGHIDALATPARMRAELGINALRERAGLRPGDAGFDRAQAVFGRAGSALGRGLAHVSNIVNPSGMIVYMSEVLASPAAGTAAEAYTAGMRHEVSAAFAAGQHAEYVALRDLPADPTDSALLGARSVAVCVLESFIEHALRLDSCKSGLRRPSNKSAAS